MLNEQEFKAIKSGQGVLLSPPERLDDGMGVVRIVPIRSRRTGKVVRFNVYYENPGREGMGVRK